MTGPRLRGLVGILLVLGVAACANTSQIDHKHNTPGDPVMSLLNKGITQLNVNINVLSKRIHAFQQASTEADPILKELQALDLSGWQLHQQQWVLQRDHLVLVREFLQRADKTQDPRGQLLDQWRQHLKQYTQSLAELRQQRQDLESKHLEVEGRLLERGFQ
jgi:hypothetical protein